jgi:RNA-dependent RNA polymerase
MKDSRRQTRCPAKMFQTLYGAQDIDDVEENTEVGLPKGCVMVPRLLLTPSQVRLTGYQIEVSNRMVREYLSRGFDQEDFIRVTVGDENGDKLFSGDLSEPVAIRIKKLLLDGISLNGKRYSFLAYSSSQLKELSVWIVQPRLGVSPEMMRNSMGDFSMCKTPPKYAARIGQCFSTTFEASTRGGPMTNAYRLLVKDDFPEIIACNSDTGETMPHSDGVGIIKKETMEQLLRRHPHSPKNPAEVSAIQIRFGGAKGVLMAWDFNQLHCSGVLGSHDLRRYDIFLRDSMVKFKAPYRQLEIVSIAMHVPYYLNRAVILLASFQGVQADVFVTMQSEMLSGLDQMLTDSVFAATFVPGLGGPDSATVSTLTALLETLPMPQDDPFLFSCLHAVRARHLMDLRKKARVHVPKGVVLLGGIDELGVLQEGQVFLSLRTSRMRGTPCGSSVEYEPVVGPVMVTKHPVTHPGDIRMLEAVDILELRGQRNVILFSQHGQRPEANKMSGSDLDGDQFAVTWDERLFLKKNAAPMDYFTPPTCEEEVIDDNSLIKHFINHARADNLGRIANLWLDHAVNEDPGCSICLQLASRHSIAVDFPKTGIPASIPEEALLHRDQPRAHWREKQDSPSFRDDGVLGRLFDNCVGATKVDAIDINLKAVAARGCDEKGQILIVATKPEDVWLAKKAIYDSRIPIRLGWSSEARKDILPDLQVFANEQRRQYENRLTTLMDQYRIKCEGEIVTGCILKFHRLQERKRHAVSEEVQIQFRIICNEFRSEFFRAAHHLHSNHLHYFSDRGLFDDGRNSGPDENDVDPVTDNQLDWIEFAAGGGCTTEKGQDARDCSRLLAAAYYIAAYSPDMHDVDSNTALFSFPWVVAADFIALGLSNSAS